MDAQTLSYVIQITEQGNTQQTVQNLTVVENQAKKTGDGLKQLGDQAKTALATIGSALAIHAAMDSFLQYEQAAARLTGTLKAIGQYSPEFRAELDQQAKAFSQMTLASSQTVMEVQNLLLSFGAARKDMPELTQAVLDLSASLGIDARTAAMEIGKALEGIDGPLKRMGISIDQNASIAEKFASIMVQLKARVGGVSEEMKKGAEGPMDSMNKAVGGLTKEFGKLALEGLLPSMQLTTQLANATKHFLETSPQAAGYTKQMIELSAALGTFTAGARGFGMTWELVMGKAVTQAGSLGAVLKALPTSIKVAIIATAIYEAARAGQEGFGAAKALDQQADSELGLAGQNDKRRASIEKYLDDLVASGSMAPREADEYRTKLVAGFAQKTAFTDATEMSGPLAIKYRDADAEYAALNSIYKQLGYGRSASSSSISEENANVLQARKTALEELAKLEEELNAKTLEGFAQQRAEAQKAYDDANEKILNTARHGGLSPYDPQIDAALQANQGKLSTRLTEIDRAEREKKLQDQQRLIDLQQQFTIEGLEGLQKEIALENERYQKAIAAINAAKGLSDDQQQELLDANDHAHETAIKGFGNSGTVAAGRQVDLSLQAEKMSPWAAETVKINAEYDKRKKDLTDYYNWQLVQAQDDADKELQIEDQKTAALLQLEKDRQHATSQLRQDLITIGTYAENSFSAGLSNAFMSIIQGTKSAGQAFQEFAQQFLAQVAQMIMQMAILRIVQAGVGSLGGGTTATANGGMFTRAASGVMLAAAGISGVSQVNGPTYFPNFNVLAGEAGSEMMTVLSRPATVSVGGMPAVLGSVGADRLAVMSQDNLSRLVRGGGRAFASGGMAGISPSSLAPGSDQGSLTHVHVSLDPGLRAEIVTQSVETSRLTIAQDLVTDTPVRRAARDAAS